MKEYHADVILTNELEEWLLLQEATVRTTVGLPYWDRKKNKFVEDIDVFFGHRQIYFWKDTNPQKIRIFFNEDTMGCIPILLLKFPTQIEQHTFPKEIV